MATDRGSFKDVVTLGAIAGLGYVLYLLLQQASKIGSAAAGAVGNATNAATSTIANTWLSLTSSPAMRGVPGNILFPDGNVIPLSGTALKTDPSGNVYVMAGGALYQLGQSDANGNWPATLALQPDLGVTGTGW